MENKDTETESHGNETRRFIGLNEEVQLSEAEIINVLKKVTTDTYIYTASIREVDIKNFNWTGEVLPELIPDKNNPAHKIYKLFEPFWFASSTQGIPLRESVKTAYTVACTLQSLVNDQNIVGLENLVAQISYKTYQDFCNFYKLPQKETEALFDDNATLVTYQFLGMTNISRGSHIVITVDIGQTLRQTLSNEIPEEKMFKFKPAVNIWNEKDIDEYKIEKLGPLQTSLINTFCKEDYQSDIDFLRDIKDLIRQYAPNVFIIPSVTSCGRKLPFIEACTYIKSFADSGYAPIVILDDAQGLSRLQPADYFKNGTNPQIESIWNYTDAILTTGAKAVGALTGTGIMLINKTRFHSFERRVGDSPFQIRSRKYGFVSSDKEKMNYYNSKSYGLANSPELSSMSIALQQLSFSSERERKIKAAYTEISDYMKTIHGLKVVEADGYNNFSVNSIISHIQFTSATCG